MATEMLQGEGQQEARSLVVEVVLALVGFHHPSFVVLVVAAVMLVVA